MTRCNLTTSLRLFAYVVLCMALCLPGCQDPNVGIVSGTVTVDGTPAKEGYIAFFPVDGESSTAGAEIIDGQYQTEVSVGKSQVQIRVPKVVGQQRLYDTPDSPVQPIMAETLPPKYNDKSELTLEVVAGKNQQDFALTTQ